MKATNRLDRVNVEIRGLTHCLSVFEAKALLEDLRLIAFEMESAPKFLTSVKIREMDHRLTVEEMKQLAGELERVIPAAEAYELADKLKAQAVQNAEDRAREKVEAFKEGAD